MLVPPHVLAAAASFSTGEFAALTGFVAFVAFLGAAFLAYVIKGQNLADIGQSGILTLLVQVLLALFVGYGLIVLMAEKIISTEAGLPALTGITGFVVGKGTSAR